MTPILKYTLKVWQTAVFATPVIFYLFTSFRSPNVYDTFQNAHIIDLLEIFILMAIFGMILSIPSALLLWWSTDLIVRNTGMEPVYQKAILCLIGIALTFGPFLLLDYGGTLTGGDSYLCLFYTMTIGVSVWIYDPHMEGDDYTEKHGNDLALPSE